LSLLDDELPRMQALCRTLPDHDYDIRLAAEPNRGATFHFSIPG
jgi:hypothetical protein